MRPAGAELLESREVVPGHWLQAWRAPAVAAGVRAGQFVHVRAGDGAGPEARRPAPVMTVDRAAGSVTVSVPVPGRVPGWLRLLRPGDTAEVAGPLGRPFEVDPRARHLLLVADGAGIGALRLLAEEAVRDARSVVLLAGAASAREVFPSSLLPDEVEYVVATADGSLGHHGPVADLVLAYEAWADQAFASGPAAVLGAVARLAAGRRARLGVATLGRKRGSGKPLVAGSPEARRRAFLQVCVPQAVGCAAATCLGCAVEGTAGPLRACREGPAFAADELAWGEPA